MLLPSHRVVGTTGLYQPWSEMCLSKNLGKWKHCLGGFGYHTTVLQIAAILCDKFHILVSDDIIERGLVMGGCQTLGEFLPGWRMLVVGLISRRPERISSYVLSRSHGFQDGVVREHFFKGDTATSVNHEVVPNP